MSYYLHLKLQNVFKEMSLCLQASFVCCKYVLKYATEHLLGDIKNFLSNVFFQFCCCLQIIGKYLSSSIFLVSLHPCPTVLYAQNWLHVAEFFTSYRVVRYLIIRKFSVTFMRAFMVRWIFSMFQLTCSILLSAVI
jgi:hypothetical protein